MSDVSLRTYAFVDRLQPQCAAHIAATCQGDVPLAGNAELFIEMAPGNEVFHVADVALKAADVKPALQIIEREFGLLELHANSQAEVLAARSPRPSSSPTCTPTRRSCSTSSARERC
jgi:hypothetical protein